MTRSSVCGWLIAAFLMVLVGLRPGVGLAEEAAAGTPAPEGIAGETPALQQAPVRVGPRTQFTIGSFDISSAEELPGVLSRLKEQLPRMKAAGVTSHETYVRWNLVEKSPGQFDFTLYDQIAQLDNTHGIRWVPFLIIGPGYATPEWFYNSRDSVKYVCLEHGEESSVESLWNPRLRRRITRFIREFAAHYRPMQVIESVLLGITGNYGEAIYPATSGEDWTSGTHGKYHSHPGYWAGDEYAVRDFQRWLRQKYGNIANLNREWRTNHRDYDTVKTFTQDKAPSTAAWFDMIRWYKDSMNEWASFWMRTARQYFPDEDIYLCTGGDAEPRHGSDFGDQCKIAASVNGGVRITNEASSYPLNFSLTRWAASAGKLYGSYYGFEPAGGVTPEAVAGRCYNATASGAKQVHYYFPNIFGSAKAEDNWLKAAAFFQKRNPKVEIAIFYPTTDIELNGQKFLHYPRQLRDFFDFDYLSEGMIRDGGLKRYKALVFAESHTVETATLRRIRDWCLWEKGIAIFSKHSPPLRTVEGDELLYQRILETDGAIVDEGPREGYFRFVAETLTKRPVLSSDVRQIIAEDTKTPNLFFTLFEDGEILIYNESPKDVTWGFEFKEKYMRPTIPAYGIWSSKTADGAGP